MPVSSPAIIVPAPAAVAATLIMDETVFDILPQAAAFDPAIDADAFFAAVPGRWCVALLCDAAGQPLQLVCAKNLRSMLRRRLELLDDIPAGPTKRVDYRELVRTVRWRRVDSEFEMDLVYIDAARLCFPTHWRQLIPDRTAYFVRVDPADPFPDFVRETAPTAGARVFGPFMDRAKADRWVEQMRDAFDLCRYRKILVQAPAGKACAYKQMNKCPAPCDGSISMDRYREMVHEATEVARSPTRVVAQLTERMKQHAAQLEFEEAGRVKAQLSTIERIVGGAERSVRPIESFRYVAIQPGPRRNTAKIFVATADGVVEALDITRETATFADVAAVVAQTAVLSTPWPHEVLLGTVCHHLSSPKSSARFVAAADLNEASFTMMLRAAMKVEAQAEDAEPIRETRLQV